VEESTPLGAAGRHQAAASRSRVTASFMDASLRAARAAVVIASAAASRTARAVSSAVSRCVSWLTTPQPNPKLAGAARREAIRILADAEAGRPHVSEDIAQAAGSVDAARSAASVRATRASRTRSGAAHGVREVRRFLEANPGLLAASASLGSEEWDVVFEAFVFAEAGQAIRCPWQRARRPQDPSAARSAGSARALLERLGHVTGATWCRTKAMATALGVRDPEDVRHHPPIFTWELVEGLRLQPAPASPWEMAAAALLTTAAISAKSKCSCLSLLVREVAAVGDDSIRVSAGPRQKITRARATGRQRKQTRPVLLQHWLIGAHVIPWIAWHQRHGSPGSALFFPSLYAKQPPSPSGHEFRADGQWVEPMREWSDRSVSLALQKYVYRLGSRTFSGFRAGNNRELRRCPGVSAVTRRSLHERSLRPIIGSEEAYDAPFAEDFASATAQLGRMRIEQTPDGLLTVTATSSSAGRSAADWVATPAAAAATPASPTSSDDDGTSSDEEGTSFTCARCGRIVGVQDYGWLCDTPDCTWGVCTACHRGGRRARLLCPRHEEG